MTLESIVHLINAAASYLQSSGGRQLVSLSLIVVLIAFIAYYARLAMRDLDQVIEDNIRLENKRSRGRPPIRPESKRRRYQELKDDVAAKRALLNTSVTQFGLSVLFLPTLLLMYLAWIHGVVFPGEPGLAITANCECPQPTAQPGLAEIIAFVSGELLVEPLAMYVRTMVGLADSAVQLVSGSKLAYAVTLYKLSVPGVSAIFIFETYPRLRRALDAIPKELERLGQDPVAVGA